MSVDREITSLDLDNTPATEKLVTKSNLQISYQNLNNKLLCPWDPKRLGDYEGKEMVMDRRLE